jgi:hypothetical protein
LILGYVKSEIKSPALNHVNILAMLNSTDIRAGPAFGGEICGVVDNGLSFGI